MMLFPLVLGFSSCDKAKELEPNPLAKQLSGLWWSLTDISGTLPQNFSGQDYTRMGQAFQLNEDGTGYSVTFFFNDENGNPIYVVGGKSMAKLTYTTTSDGRIHMDFGKAYYEYADFYDSFTVIYADGMIMAANGDKAIVLTKADDSVSVMIEEWDNTFNGGASADNYNINDEDFTPETWRDQEAIYIYDATGKDVTDAKGRTGYTLVNMPWYQGDVLTNLPEGFCDDITPGNGWEWVLNRCGSRAIVNNNFFAVYNKYTGILRFFYYLPYGFNAGNDHVWQVSMTDHLAQQSVWRYGLPSDKTLTDKAAIGQTGNGTFVDYVTPWVDYMSPDGLITPNAGWWAFDVDLSQTRADDIQPTDNIKLQMRSWNTSHVSLASTVAANIDGDLTASFDLTKTSVSSAKGITESFSDIKNIGTGIFNTVKSAMSGKWMDAIKAGIGVAKDGYTLYGAMTKETTTTVDTLAKGSLTGTVTLAMKGNIDTEGTIRGSVPTVGIASPTIYLKDFDTKNSHLGQGVWNLKTAPVVYWTNVDAWWREEEYIHGYDNSYIGYLYCQMTPYFFDPNSIEIDLNPDLFPAGDIEWVEVNAICGARKDSQLQNDALRSAFGAGGSTTRKFAKMGNAYEYSDGRRYEVTPYRMQENGILVDFLLDFDDKCGMQPSYDVYSNDAYYRVSTQRTLYWTEYVRGRGADGYAIEPQYLSGFARDTYMPFLEVSVTVMVKLRDKDKPIVLSRNYLPEIKVFDATEFENAVRKTKPYASLMTGHTALYDYQMTRIYSILDDFDIDAVFPDGYKKLIATGGTGGTGNEGYQRLFDGTTDTKWCTNEKRNDVFYVEFKSNGPIRPAKYYLTTANDTKSYPGRNPKSWKLMAKANEEDAWSTIATVTGDSRLPADNFKRVEYNLDVTGKQWQYFRFEISEIVSGYAVQLAEFDFGTN